MNTWKVRPNGAGFASREEPREFLGATQATDVEFGPDCRMYFSEWGAEGWESQGRGRIYRVTNTAAHAEQKAQMDEVQRLLREGFAQRATEELVKLLGHPDQRIRLRCAVGAGAEMSVNEPTEEALDVAARLSARIQPRRKTNAINGRALHAVWAMGQVTRFISAERLKTQPGFQLHVPQEARAMTVARMSATARCAHSG